MVTPILSARLTLLLNGLARSRGQLVGTVVGAVLLLAALVVVVVAMATTPLDADDRTLLAVGAGASFTLGWTLGPVLALGADSSLTVEHLRAYPLRRRDVMVGTALAGLVGLPGLLALGVLIMVTTLWAGSSTLVLFAAGTSLLGLAVAVLAQRIVVDGLAVLASSRRSREAAGLVVLALVVLALPAWWLVTGGAPITVLMSVETTDLLAWTPFGAAWAVPAAVAAEDPARAAGHLAVAAGSAVLLAAAWAAVVARRMAPRPDGGQATRAGLGPFALVPDSVGGAVTARTLTAWTRDPRYTQNLVFALVLPLLGIGIGAVSGTWSPMLIYVVTSVLLVAASGSLDISNDSLAHAVHVVAGVSGRDDRVGRMRAHALVTLPVAAAALAVAAVQLDLRTTVAFGGVLIAVAAGAIGTAAVTSAMVVVPVASGREGAPASRSGAGPPTFALFAAAAAVAAVAAVPATVLTVLTAVSANTLMAVAALATGVVTGGASLVAGAVFGGRLLDRRGPALYEALLRVA